MLKKEGLLLVLVATLVLILITGCGDKTELVVCEPPSVIIGESCCTDSDNNTLCDDAIANATNMTVVVCGNSICENQSENCTTCWKDCGACRQIIYVYLPRNFTLGEITEDMNALTRDGIKFRKDISSLNNVSNFFFFEQQTPRYFADFLDVKYKLLYPSRMILLNHISNNDYYVNDTASLFKYMNYTNWYITGVLRNKELVDYETRISKNLAKADYPTQPTGYKKEFMYAEWEFRNYTKKESVLYDSVTALNNGLVESVFASITNYSIIYRSGQYINKDYNNEDITIDQFRTVDEKRMSYIHALSFTCSRNLVITLYDYTYDERFYSINDVDLATQISANRAKLETKAALFKSICDSNYSRKIFTYS